MAARLDLGQVTGREYLAASLSYPDFAPRTTKRRPGRAAGQDDDVFTLIWNAED